jgi:lysophospholipase L1-like esterase
MTGLAEAGFRFKIPDNSYLDIILDKQSQEFSGIRLSRSGAFASGYFSSGQDGRFYSFEPVKAGEIGPGWHQARLVFSDKGLSLKLDDGEPIRLNAHHGPARTLGFRAGFFGAVMDDFEARDAHGALFADSFRNGRGWLGLVAIHFALLAAIFGVAAFFLLKGVRWGEARVMNGSLVVAAQIFICLSLFHAFDFFFWSKLPFQTGMRLFSTGQPVPQLLFERYRSEFFTGWRSLLGKEQDLLKAVSANYPPDRIFQGPIFCGSSGEACLQNTAYSPGVGKKSCARFLLLGTSQSVGSGAHSLEQSFFVRLHRGLSKSLAGRCVESMNLSVSGSNLAALADLFRKHLDFYPDVVVLNFSNNGSSDGLYEKLQRIVEVSREIHTRLIFVAEANSPDGGENYGLNQKHEIMKRAGQDAGIETFSMQDFLSGEKIPQSGQVWWDHVHLTTYGHALVASWLQPKILATLRNKSEMARSRGSRAESRRPGSNHQ